jgi:hypothetical protein
LVCCCGDERGTNHPISLSLFGRGCIFLILKCTICIRELTWQHVSSMYCKVIMSKSWIGGALWVGGQWLAIYRIKFVEVLTWLWGPCASIHRYMFITFANLLVTFSNHTMLLEWFASCCCSCMLCLTEVLHLYGFAKVFMQHVIHLPCFLTPHFHCVYFLINLFSLKGILKTTKKYNIIGNKTIGRVD